MKKYYILLIIIMYMSGANSQDIIDLKSYLTSVVAHSFGSRQAQSQLKRAEADFSLFRSQLKPQFSINAFLPTFTRTSASVTQPNGSIAFQSVYQNIGSFSVFAQQPILLTGGTLFAETSLDRFDDFSQRSKIFNGIPIRIGYRQNLIGFNQWKWAKKIEENRLFTNKKQFSFEIENIQMQAVFLYFDALIAQSNLAIADSNRMVNEKLLIIAEERLDLGKISKDEKLQMEAEYKQAVMQLAQSENLYKQTKINIQNILSNPTEISQALLTPTPFDVKLPPVEDLIQLALDYSPDIFQSLLDLDIQNRNMHQVKAEMSPTLQVFASMGLAQSGSTINEVYQQPFNEQQLRAGLSIPIVDWGRKRAAITSSKLQIEMTHLDLESRRQSLSNRVSQRYFDMQEISTRLKLQTELINLSEERYRISKERYTAGAILITELVFAQRNKDQAIRDYLISLRDYYVAYYDLRRLTGYDIKTGTLIQQ